MYLQFMNWVRHGSSTTFETGLKYLIGTQFRDFGETVFRWVFFSRYKWKIWKKGIKFRDMFPFAKNAKPKTREIKYQ